MEYTIPWIEKHLGITRKTIKYYEKNGLIPEKKGHNKMYTQEEIQWIWIAKTLVRIGYKHEELRNIKKKILKNEQFEFTEGAKKNINRIDEEIKLLQRCKEVARTVERTGRLPIIPNIGDMKFEEFYEQIENYMSFKNSRKLSVMKFLSFDSTMQELEEDEEAFALVILNTKFQGASEVFYNQILKQTSETAQKTIEEYYEYTKKYFKNIGMENELSRYEFSIEFSPKYFEGEIGQYWSSALGDGNCIHINQQMAIFGNREEFEGIIKDIKIEEE